MKHIWTLIKNFLFGNRSSNQSATPPLEDAPFSYRDAYMETYVVKQPSQTSLFIDEIQAHGKISLLWMKTHGLKRGQRIVSELRKKGWEIKTTIIVKNGQKDVVYSLIHEPQPIGI
jgi:hypothetical protein